MPNDLSKSICLALDMPCVRFTVTSVQGETDKIVSTFARQRAVASTIF